MCNYFDDCDCDDHWDEDLCWECGSEENLTVSSLGVALCPECLEKED